MKERQDKWIENFREHMKDYSEDVPQNTWASLEKDLDLQSNRRKIGFQWAAVAATILVLVGFSISFYILFTPTHEYMREMGEVLTEYIDEKVVEEKLDEPTEGVKQESIATLSTKKEKVFSYPKEEVKILENGNDEENSVLIEQEKDTLDSGSSKEVGSEQNIARTPYNRSNTGLFADNYLRASKQKRDTKWSIGLSGSNGISERNNFDNTQFISLFKASSPAYMSPGDSENMGVDVANGDYRKDERTQVFIKTMDQKSQTDVKHKMPVSFGASFRYEFSEQFAIESGLVYTMLSSDVRGGSQTDYYTDNYKLHYLGIPLKGSWTFFRKDIFTLYMSAGTMLEKSLAGELKKEEVLDGKIVRSQKEDLKVKELQWSLLGALGAQININKYLGFYVEPGVVHYFDDGSNIETIRKNKPTNFNLQFGLRFSY